MSSPKWQELLDEFRHVVAVRRPWGDAIGPPFVFLLIHLCCGVWPAIWGAVGLAVLITTVRLIRRHPLRYALGGLAGVTIASLAAVLLDRGEGFFLPGMVERQRDIGRVSGQRARPAPPGGVDQLRRPPVGRPPGIGIPESARHTARAHWRGLHSSPDDC